MSSTKTPSPPHALMATPTPHVNLWVVLSESKRIINSHSLHFLALSVLFLLPISLSPSVFHLIIKQSQNSISLIHEGDQPPHAGTSTKVEVLIQVRYIVALAVTVFNLLAIGSITYSVFQGFYGRPVKFISSVKSSFTSFFPLLATLISREFIVIGISLILGLAVFSLTKLITCLEIGVLPLFVIVMVISSVTMLKFHVDWIIACVVVVVESKVRGLTPLKRSKSLTKGNKSVSLSIIFFFAATQFTLGWLNRRATSSARILDNDVFFALWIVIASAFRTFLILYNLVAITVMYMYCKAFHGELAWEIAEDYTREYISLPFDDDGKVYNNV